MKELMGISVRRVHLEGRRGLKVRKARLAFRATKVPVNKEFVDPKGGRVVRVSALKVLREPSGCKVQERKVFRVFGVLKAIKGFEGFRAQASKGLRVLWGRRERKGHRVQAHREHKGHKVLRGHKAIRVFRGWAFRGHRALLARKDHSGCKVFRGSGVFKACRVLVHRDIRAKMGHKERMEFKGLEFKGRRDLLESAFRVSQDHRE
jgi:hypothetical protein